MNDLACRWFEKELGAHNTLRLASKEESENTNLPVPKDVLFRTRTDFINLAQELRKQNPYGEVEFDNNASFEEFVVGHQNQIVPMFFVKENNEVELISGYSGKHESGKLILY